MTTADKIAAGQVNVPELAPGAIAAGARIDALDLEPIVFKMMSPHPGVTGLSLAEADQRIAGYRCFLKLCAWYPGEPIVPATDIDDAWHAHILDTGKYAADCQVVFGAFMGHFPYLGLRGEADVLAWNAAYARTRELFRRHFGAGLPAGAAAGACGNGGGSTCQVGGSICSSAVPCDRSMTDTADLVRPRPDRSLITA